jgi:hypothetical protein
MDKITNIVDILAIINTKPIGAKFLSKTEKIIANIINNAIINIKYLASRIKNP